MAQRANNGDARERVRDGLRSPGIDEMRDTLAVDLVVLPIVTAGGHRGIVQDHDLVHRAQGL